MTQEAQQLIITPDNYSMIADAVRHALAQGLAPAFVSLTDDLSPLKKGEEFNFSAVDADGDLRFEKGYISRKQVILPRIAITCGEERVKALAAAYRDEEVRKLNGLADSFDKENTFGRGDIVEWKPGMRDTNYPRPGQIAIVMVTDRFVPMPHQPDHHDLILGVKDEGTGILIRILADGRRFQLVARASDRQGE